MGRGHGGARRCAGRFWTRLGAAGSGPVDHCALAITPLAGKCPDGPDRRTPSRLRSSRIGGPSRRRTGCNPRIDRHRRSPTEDELVAVDNVGAIDSAAAAWEVGCAGRAGLDRGLWVQGPLQREGPTTEIPGLNAAEGTGTCSMSTDVRHRELRSRRPSSASSTSRRWDQGARSRGRGAVTGVRSSVGWPLARARRCVDNRADVKRGSHVTNWAHDRQGDCESVCLRGRLLRNSIKPRALWAGEGSGPQSRRTSSWSAPRAGLGGDLQESAGASSYRS